MKSETYPLAVPPDLLIEVRRTAKETGLSLAEAMRQSLKLGLPKLREHSVVDGRKKRKKTKKESRLDKSLDERSFPRMRPISELAKEALELPPPQRLTLARILLDLSDEAPDFSPDAEAAWEQREQRAEGRSRRVIVVSPRQLSPAQQDRRIWIVLELVGTRCCAFPKFGVG